MFSPPNKGEGDFFQYGLTDIFVKAFAFQNNIQGSEFIQYSGTAMKNTDSDSDSDSDADSSSEQQPIDDDNQIKTDLMATIDGIYLVGEDQQKKTKIYKSIEVWHNLSLFSPSSQNLKKNMRLARDISKKGICFGYTHCGTKFRLFFMNSDRFEEIQLGKSVVPLSFIFILTRLMRSLSVRHFSLSSLILFFFQNCLFRFSKDVTVMKGTNCVFKRITSSFFKSQLYKKLDEGKKSQFLIHLEKYDNEEDEGRIILKLTPLCERQSTAKDVTAKVWSFIACVLLALNDIHNAGYCHRDIRYIILSKMVQFVCFSLQIDEYFGLWSNLCTCRSGISIRFDYNK